jgi:phosphohistidine phosphatase
MKILTLIRHAKAVDAAAGEDDHERPLRERGRHAAMRLGRDTAGTVPDLVLCSTALRTRETFAYAARSWKTAPPVSFERELYLIDAIGLRQRIERLDPAFRSVWLIGHNPGVHELARELAIATPGRQRFAELAHRFPTAARAVFSIDVDDWHDWADARLDLTEFMVPPVD